MHKTHSQESLLETHSTLCSGRWDSAPEHSEDRTLHSVNSIASGPGTGDDLSAVLSAVGGGHVCLGTAPTAALGPGGRQGSAAGARSSSRLMARPAGSGELRLGARALQLDESPRGTERQVWLHGERQDPRSLTGDAMKC